MTTILAIDDEEIVTRTIEHSLRGDYLVWVAHSGVEGLKMARQVRPDLIILDVNMPGMDGIKTCRELRSDPLLQSVPVLFLTARTRVEDRIEGFDAGADDYMVKPFDVRELRARVMAILRRVWQQGAGESQEVTLLKIGNLTLDCRTYQVKTPQKSVLLTPVEFDLLYHLMSHPGEIFSGERLLREVWDYPTDTGSPDLVRMHIKNLRQKIETDGQSPVYIKTVPRYGYTISGGD